MSGYGVGTGSRWASSNSGLAQVPRIPARIGASSGLCASSQASRWKSRHRGSPWGRQMSGQAGSLASTPDLPLPLRGAALGHVRRSPSQAASLRANRERRISLGQSGQQLSAQNCCVHLSLEALSALNKGISLAGQMRPI